MSECKKTFWIFNQYASTPLTGFGGRSFYLANELARQGHEVVLIASSFTHLLQKTPELEHDYLVEDNAENFKFVWVRVPKYSQAHSIGRVFNWFVFAFKLLKLPKIISSKPDVIINSSPSLISFLSSKYLASKFKSKLGIEIRDIWPLSLIEIGGYSKYHPFVLLLQWLEDYSYRVSDVVISNLPYAVDHMVSRGMSRDKFHWIPNGFDIDDLNYSVSLAAPSISKLPSNSFIVGYTGSLGVANSLVTLLDAAELLQDCLDIYFVIVGNGKLKEFLIQRSSHLKNVIFIDAIPKRQIQSMLSKFDVCYLGLTNDPLFRFGVSPNKLFDYFLASKPVLYSINSGKYRPVNDAVAGISVPSECPQAVADAVLKFKSMSNDQLIQLGTNGNLYLNKHHSYHNLAKKLLAAFSD